MGLKKYGAGSDPHPNRTEFNLMVDILENNTAMFAFGSTINRPTAGKQGRLYFDTSVSRLYWDSGTSWEEVTTNGGGGAGKTILTSGDASEGTSSRSARADHTHVLPLATAAAAGAMSAADKALLDGAVATATANTLAKRSASGTLQVVTGTSGNDAANKTYVDQQVGGRAPSSHSHSWASITGKPTTFAPSSHSHDWNSITGKPSSFNPSSHNHTGLENGSHYLRIDSAGRVYGSAVYDRTYNDLPNMFITSAGTLGRATKIPSERGHTHSWSSITGKPAVDEADQVTSSAYGRSINSGTYYAMWMNSSRYIGRNTSSIRFKENVRDYPADPDAVLALRAVIYDRKPDEEGNPGNTNEFGLIAEEVHEHVPEIVTYFDGEIDSVRYDLLAVALLPVLQRQAEQIALLQQQVKALPATEGN